MVGVDHRVELHASVGARVALVGVEVEDLGLREEVEDAADAPARTPRDGSCTRSRGASRTASGLGR